MTEIGGRPRRARIIPFAVGTILLLPLGSAAGAQGMAVAPLKGQSAQQAETDRQQCYASAVQSSGHDPAGARGPQQSSGGRVKGGAAGAQAFANAYTSCLTARGYSVQ